jgi:trehalose-6-phosphatase
MLSVGMRSTPCVEMGVQASHGFCHRRPVGPHHVNLDLGEASILDALGAGFS